MFHHIPSPIRQQMHYLETIDHRDRHDGTPRLQRLRQIPPETRSVGVNLSLSPPP